jgi:methionyl aminopeptidase
LTVFEENLKAGRIAGQIRHKLLDSVYPGKPIFELCEEIEKDIRVLGGLPAFPCNVGINEIAAHYTSGIDDTTIIPKEGIVKVDFGVHINGYIADTAVSIPLSNEYRHMVKVVEDALTKAIEYLKPGVKPKTIGEVVEQTIREWGYKPIRNLMGHKMERFALHAGNSIPNIGDLDGKPIQQGEVYAIEPFLTTSNGKGEVTESNQSFIYRLHKEKGIKDTYMKNLVKIIKNQFYTLPFTLRWLQEEAKNLKFTSAFSNLITKGYVKDYHVLVEKSGEPVTQAEHTILITKDGCKILTE